MRLSEICIHRPVLTVVISLALILLGILGYNQLDLRAAPKVFAPHLSIMVQAPGSSAEFVEENITTRLEGRLQNVPYLDYMYSEADQGMGKVSLHFRNITPEEFLSAESQVLEAVSSTDLPANAEKPHIRQGGTKGTQVLVFTVTSDRMGQHAFVDYVSNNIYKALQQVPGVGDIHQSSTDDILKINLLPEKMALLHISVQQVQDAINNNNQDLQAGEIVNNAETIPITLKGKLASVSDFQNLVISNQNNHLIRLSDVANVGIGNSFFGGAYSYYNGKQAAVINIRANDNANPIALGDDLHDRLTQIERSLPPGMSIHVMFNGGEMMKKSVTELYWTIIESILLVALVTLLFLGRPRFALIPIVTIPVCIIASFTVIWLLGFSINLLSLLALVVGVGLVVDDAIVVLENCHRHIENGESPFAAATSSLKQITFPVIGMTISLFAVYLPSAFMQGEAAVFIQQFAFTLAGAVIISGFIALTLTPMMCARLLTPVGNTGYDLVLNRFFTGLRNAYKRVLSWVLWHQMWMILVFIILLCLGAFIFKQLPSTLTPAEYGLGFIRVIQVGPDSSGTAYMQKIFNEIYPIIKADPAVESVISFAGGQDGSDSSAFNGVQLKPAYRNSSDTVKVSSRLSKELSSVVGAKMIVTPDDESLGSSGDDGNGAEGMMYFYISGFAPYGELAKATQKMSDILKTSKMFENVTNQLKFSSQQYQVTINRELATKLHVPITTINQAMSTYFGGYGINNGFLFNGVSYDIMVQLPSDQAKDFQVLNSIFVSSSSGAQIPLSRLLTVKSAMNLAFRQHINGVRSGEINVQPKLGVTPGQVVKFMQSVAKNNLPTGMSLTYTHKVRQMLSGNNNIAIIFLMGIVFIYLVLAALFESFIDPLVILFTVPLCIVGALAVLWMIGGSFNVYTGIGLITLVGLVSKHGVLIVHFANELKDKTIPIKEAVLQAATIRMRPILMTTATMIIGALPLLFYGGIGSNSRTQLGTVIIAGLLVGTFFSLFVVPVAYSLFSRFKKSG